MGGACGKMCSPKENRPGKGHAETSTTRAAQVASRDGSTPAVPALAPTSAPAQEPQTEDRLCEPAYVFETCDTDLSGRLDEHELRFALNAFGFFPQPSTVVNALGGLEDADKDGFEKILARFQRGELQAERRHRTVPYALRGISLGQLEDLHDTFVASGWIQERCDEFNLAHAEDIAAGKAYKMEANLYALDRFVIRPATNHECPESTRVPKNMQQQAKLPEAKYKCSYCELLNPNGVCVDFFVSHFWGHLFADTMQALRGWARRSYKSLGKERPEDVVFWLCFLALNQHAAGDEVGSSPEMGPFNAALVRATGAIMILDESIHPFKRIWCLFEVYRLTMLRRQFRLVCSMGPIATLLNEVTGEQKQEAIEYVKKIEEALSTVSAFGADASSVDDKYAIWHRIADPRVQQLPLSKLISANMFGANVFKRFDSTVRGLLAAPLLQASLTDKDKDACIRAVGLGAAFNDEALDFLQTSGVNVTTVLVKVKRGDASVDWTLLHAAAFFGHLEGLEVLVARGADLESRTSFHYTPLHLAASNSRPEICRRLVELKADVASTTNLQRSAISMASINADFEVVNALIQLGSPVDIQEVDGSTPIMSAATSGSVEVMEALVKAGATIQVKNLKAQTPLSKAIQNNQLKAATYLLDRRADVMEADSRGMAPLHLAALNGYTEMVQVLLDAKADVHALCYGLHKKGEAPSQTALKLALMKHHDETAALLKRAEDLADSPKEVSEEATNSPARGGRWRRSKREGGEDAAASGETIAKESRGQEEAAGAAILSALSGGAASIAASTAAAVPEPVEDASKAGGKGRRRERGGIGSKDSLPKGGKGGGGGGGGAAAASAASADKGKSGSMGGAKGGAKAAWEPVPSDSAVQWEAPSANWGVREDAGGWWSGAGDEVDVGRGGGGGRRRRGRRGGADKVAPR